MNKNTVLAISLFTALSAALPAAASVSSITYKPIPDAPGAILWMNSVIRPAGVPADQPVTICVTQQVVTYHVGRDTTTIVLPDAAIVFKPWETIASATFSGTRWETSEPSSSAAYETFVSGTEYPSALLPAGSADMTWSARFESDLSGVSVAWRWGAGSYAQFTDNENALDVVPVDERNLDRAGTPYAFKSYVVGGNDADANDFGDTRFTGNRTPAKQATADLSATCGGVY